LLPLLRAVEERVGERRRLGSSRSALKAFHLSFCLKCRKPSGTLMLTYEFVPSQISREPGGKASQGFGQPAGGRRRKSVSDGSSNHPLLRSGQHPLAAGAHSKQRSGPAPPRPRNCRSL